MDDGGGGGGGGVDDDRAARRRRRRRWTLAAAGALLVAGVVLLSALGGRYEPPWTVWAVRTSAPGVTPPTFGRVSATVGGEDLSGEWDAWSSALIGPGADASIFRNEPMGFVDTLRFVFRGHDDQRSRIYQRLDVERVDHAGATWVRFLEVLNAQDVMPSGTEDPRCIGTWELTGDHGGVARVRLDPDDGVTWPYTRWSVRDGVLWAALSGTDGKWVEFSGVLAPDAASFTGLRDSWPVTGRKVAE